MIVDSCPSLYCVQVANGLQLYFDTALQHMLLYRQEQDRHSVSACPVLLSVCCSKWPG